MTKTRSLALCGLLTAAALVLSLIERMFPLPVPLPGARLGLANLVTLFALHYLNTRQTLAILLCRILLAALLSGSISALLFSFLGGMCAFLAMRTLLPLSGRFCSVLGISAAGAACHHIGQMVAAVFWMQTSVVLAYLPPLLLLSVPLGLITGLFADIALSHLKKIGFRV